MNQAKPENTSQELVKALTDLRHATQSIVFVRRMLTQRIAKFDSADSDGVDLRAKASLARRKCHLGIKDPPPEPVVTFSVYWRDRFIVSSFRSVTGSRRRRKVEKWFDADPAKMTPDDVKEAVLFFCKNANPVLFHHAARARRTDKSFDVAGFFRSHKDEFLLPMPQKIPVAHEPRSDNCSADS